MSGDITLLLGRFRKGDSAALEELTRELYPELKRVARRRAGGSALGATTLVQETYARFLDGDAVSPRNRTEFFGLAATIMRRIVVDEVRKSLSQKRVAGVQQLNDDAVDDQHVDADFLVALDRALDLLDATDPNLRKVFECRYFAGYSTAETAEVMGVSTRSVERLWSAARKWLTDQLR